VALVTGANRGIGLEVARALAREGMRVLAGARDLDRGEAALRRLRDEGLALEALELDVTDPDGVRRLFDGLERLDVLVNNAGTYPAGRPRDLPLEVAEEAWQVNALGPWRTAQAAVPLMLRGGYGRIVNVSSEAGSLASMGANRPAYNVSKAALNAVTRVLAADLAGTGILVNSVCPGWVRTDMGGPSAPRSVEEGAASVLWAALLPDDGPTGGFFRDGRPLPW
jgi:NAD(P)-dependent dehydrogenase (short-subunit alcohol dehydrogenase family)